MYNDRKQICGDLGLERTGTAEKDERDYKEV